MYIDECITSPNSAPVYGVNLFQMLMSGGGTAPLTDADKLWETVMATDGPVTLVVKQDNMILKTQMTQQHAGSYAHGLTATIPVFYNDKRFVVYLYVIDDTAELYVHQMNEVT